MNYSGWSFESQTTWRACCGVEISFFPVTSAGIADSPKRLVSFQSESKWTIDIYKYIHISYIYIYIYLDIIYIHIYIYIFNTYIYIYYIMYICILYYTIYIYINISYIIYIYDIYMIYIYIIYKYDIYHIYICICCYWGWTEFMWSPWPSHRVSVPLPGRRKHRRRRKHLPNEFRNLVARWGAKQLVLSSLGCPCHQKYKHIQCVIYIYMVYYVVWYVYIYIYIYIYTLVETSSDGEHCPSHLATRWCLQLDEVGEHNSKNF